MVGYISVLPFFLCLFYFACPLHPFLLVASSGLCLHVLLGFMMEKKFGGGGDVGWVRVGCC